MPKVNRSVIHMSNLIFKEDRKLCWTSKKFILGHKIEKPYI